MASWDDAPIITPASDLRQQPAPQPQAPAQQAQQIGQGFAWEAAPIVTPASQRQPTPPPAGQTAQPAPQPEKPWYSQPFSDTKENQGAGTAAIRGVGDGITFGFQDEILAGLDAAVQPLIPIPENGSSAPTWSERYDENVASQRALLRAGQDQHPITSVAGAVVGGIVPALASGGMSLPGSGAAAAARQTTGRAMVQGATTGAAYGGLYGLGTAEGDIGDRVPGALQGAALGAVVGGAVPGVIGAVKGVKNAVSSPEVRAQSQLNRALERDNLTPEQFRNQFDELDTLHPGTAIPADAGGENVRGVVERLANTPGQSRTTVTDTLFGRQAGQRDRIEAALQKLTGTHKSAYQATEDVVRERAATAAPLYAAAHAEEVPWSEALESLMTRPAMQKAYRAAEVKAANQGRQFDGTFAQIGADGKIATKTVPRIGDLDIIKQNLDDQIEGLLGSNQRSKARDIIAIKNELLSIMDASAPTYAKARAAFAGHTAYKNAIEDGKTILGSGKNSEQWAAEVSRLSASEQEAVRIGALQAIVDKIGNARGELPDVAGFLRTPEGRKKIAAILPDDAARKQWTQTLDQELRVSGLTRRATSGSATARRIAERDDASGIIEDLAVAALAPGSATTGILHTLLRRLPRAAGAKINERSNRILANALTSTSGLDALNGVLPRAMVGREAPAAAGVAAGQYGAGVAERRNEPARRREERRRIEIQAATTGYYQTQLAANAALREAGIKDGYESYRADGTGAWAIRRKTN
ncbi:hypothetical protein [Pseudomonas cichorii]|uniref:Uncharacterized protein n=1 Tax=Pseudomonas cichorii TaxID=36746 RepID=A0ABQ1DTC8_PSECI|nr:hypothetical protein [Pseudomonas cichorii]AHF66006.1 hypothetical protein PCH70_08530 [Pseudomonas cichorii JBC1]QVE17971.1 hypothetical protein KGD89_04205 [Pseudomonas cichorii]SDP00718.1 hypothetical protein SAMN05216599_116143 [Pseudomonas cichorii]GFM68683.1 hypothetical protein PSCICJ_48010 [Pseudomonas cichorii]GFM94178.1 hypothetical protein PSCICP_41500 [Pseudomonas cichorii]